MKKINGENAGLQTILECSRIGTWEWNVQTGDTVFNEIWAQIVGYTLDELAPVNIKTWETLAHPDDLKRSGELLEKHFSGEVNLYDFESRMKHKDGHWVWVHDRGKVVSWSDDGRPLLMMGSHEDITDRKAFEQSLEASKKLFSSIYDSSPIGIALVEPKTQGFLRANKGFLDIVEYTEEELKTKTVPDITHPEDWEKEKKDVSDRLRNDRTDFRTEKRYVTKSGIIRHVRVDGNLLQDSDGTLVAIANVIDITDNKQTERRIEHLNRVLKAVRNVNQLITKETDRHRLVSGICNSLIETRGYHGAWLALLDEQGKLRTAAQAGLGDRYLALESIVNEDQLVYCMGISLEDPGVKVIVSPKETCGNCPLIDRYHNLSALSVRLEHRGVIYGLLSVAIPLELSEDKSEHSLFQEVADDIAFALSNLEILSKQKWAEEKEKALAEMLDIAPNSISIHDSEGHFLYCNQRTLTLHGYTRDEFMGINLHDLDVPVSETLIAERIDQIDKKGEAHFEVAHFRKDGTSFPLEIYAKKIIWEGKTALLSIATDITLRKAAEKALRESETRNRLLADLTMEGILLHKNGVAIDLNRSLVRMMGYNHDELINKNFIDFVHVDDKNKVLENIVKDYAPPYLIRLAQKGGAFLYVEIESRNFEQDGKKWRVTAVRDVSERIRTEEDLRRRENLLQRVFEILPIGLWFADQEGKLLRGNPMGIRIWGAEPQVAFSDYGIFKAWRLPSREPVEADNWALAKTIRNKVTIVDELLEIEAFDGKRKTILNSTAPVLDENGNVEGAIVVNIDISDQRMLEEELRQAQKMESIGRLAGGVAHDFNNMLGVILGYSEMAMEKISTSDSLYNDLVEIRSAAKRSADIARQLLTFARKQAITPKILDLNDTVESMLKMLRRLIGEDIHLAWLPVMNAGLVNMDPSQIDQILANICINARDAITGIGKITIETDSVYLDETGCEGYSDLLPGDYVKLMISDDGCGMSKEVQKNLFEPFFTTKEPGKGTGLGLATVYGIVRQNKGMINVVSEPGKGSCFTIYLPRVLGDTDQENQYNTGLSEKNRSVTVLLVEDSSTLLNMTAKMLQHLGHIVLTATTPAEALRVAKEHNDAIHLLLTDVIMPEMNGRDLSKTLSVIYPTLRTIFMSGYTADIIAPHGVLEKGINFIQKPFSLKDLSNKIKETIS